MKILFLTSTLPRYLNDAQAPFVFEHALAWKKARPQYEILLLAPHDVRAAHEEILEGIYIYRFIYWWPLRFQKLAYPAILPNIRKNPLLLYQLPFFLISELYFTLKLIRQKKIDLIFAHWVMPQGLIAYLANKFTRTPYAIRNHSSDVRIFQKIPFLGKWIVKKIIRNSKFMFCENTMLREEALNLFGEQRQSMEPKIRTMPMGVFSKLEGVLTSENQIYDFGFIGRLSKKKGVEFLIKAIKKIQGDISFRTLIAGDGEEREHLENLSKGSNIEFIGFVSNEAKISFFNKTKIIVFPSINAEGDIEGLPVALQEALYAGKLIITSKATNIELLPEWKDLREYVFLLHNPEDIEELMALLKKALQMERKFYQYNSARVRQIFHHYRWDTLIHDYIKLLVPAGS